MRSGSAEARRHHELQQDASSGGEVALLQKHKTTGPTGCQHRTISEADESEGTFTQNCRQEANDVNDDIMCKYSTCYVTANHSVLRL